MARLLAGIALLGLSTAQNVSVQYYSEVRNFLDDIQSSDEYV